MKQFWHMQMYPTDEPEFFEQYGRLILEHLNFIGLGDWEEKSNQIPNFVHQMQVGDIVAVKQGSELVALVEVLSLPYKVSAIFPHDKLSWLTYRRNIKVLDWANKSVRQQETARTGTLKICMDSEADTTKVIRHWYEEVKHKFTHLNISV